MNRRPAFTLIEALMAIFVMAIGLLALLTLFPLGAFSMAQAIKDQRTAETANVAVSDIKALQVQNDQLIQSPVLTVAQGGTGLSVFQDPWPQVAYPNAFLSPIVNGPSYPLYIDPLYFQNDLGATVNNTQDPSWAINRSLGFPASQIRRTTLTLGSALPPIPVNPMRQNPTRWCTLPDDIVFADNGSPDPGIPGPGITVPREGRYTFAYMVRRASANDATLPLDLTVVVYSGRQPGLDASGNPIGETQYNISYFVSDRVIQLTWNPLSQAKPKVRRGTWILDARMPGSSPGVTVPQGYFYRVTNVNDLAGDNIIEIEVQSPNGGTVQQPFGLMPPLFTGYYFGPVIVMDNVSEVFARGTNY